MNEGALVLLIGPGAAALAPRLEASGYRCQQLAPGAETAALSETAALAEAPALILVGSAKAGEAAARNPELLAWLRQRWPGVPLLLDIGRDSVPARSDCLSSGADDFWLSGLGASDLLTRLRLHHGLALERQEHAPASALSHADLRLDPERRQGQRAGRDLNLTAREYDLLLLLLRHKGSVVSRGQILAEIWPNQEEGSSNVIEVYVRYLRQKLEAGGERRLIHTVRGRGYCLGDRPPKTSRLLLALLLGASSGFASGVGQGPALGNPLAGPPQQLPITARWCLQPSRCIGLEVAASERQQSLGLQLRPPLPALRGMWFPYRPPSLARFWMHRTPEPLDMLFVQGDRVVAIEAHAQPCMRLPCPSYGPDQAVDGVLELAAGQAEALGITVGSPVRIEAVAVTPVQRQAGSPSTPAQD
ncbi:MAG: winged helix-turn-helix domain-containing protein [Prochlorococcaceae cyanobacterium]